jgi:ankyrin repeat protein
VPYPALCFAVAAGDVKIVRLLLEKGADCNKRMPRKYASLTPLCLACGVLGETGPELVKLLLDSLADPNSCSDIGTEYMSMCEEGWQHETISDVSSIYFSLNSFTIIFKLSVFFFQSLVLKEIINLVGGRTPLQIACCRNDPYAGKVIRLLLEHSSNPNIICNVNRKFFNFDSITHKLMDYYIQQGQSPLSLAIASGNKEAVDMLLKSNKCDPNLPLTNGVGSALCVISSTLYEHNWHSHERIRLVTILFMWKKFVQKIIAIEFIQIDKLMHYGADILQPIAFGPRRYIGTVVDYAYYMYNSDQRLAHTPYHSLTISERNCHNARKDLLDHLSSKYRERALDRDHTLKTGGNLNRNRNNFQNFISKMTHLLCNFLKL